MKFAFLARPIIVELSVEFPQGRQRRGETKGLRGLFVECRRQKSRRFWRFRIAISQLRRATVSHGVR